MSEIIELQCDYLIIGAGCGGMAFADVILSDSNHNIILLDRNPAPGGHWLAAYPFVRLHQPGSYYGVTSEPLEPNSTHAGLNYCNTGTEVCEYYQKVLEKFVRTKRCTFFGDCNYLGNGTFVNQTTQQRYQIKVSKRIVDSTYQNITVPSTSPPKYPVAPSVNLIPVNNIYGITSYPDLNFTVIGAGKTGIDCVLHLLTVVGCHPNQITWIVSHDPWLSIRWPMMDPTQLAYESLPMILNFHNCNNLNEFLSNQEQSGIFTRLDPTVEPTKQRCATISREEIEILKVVRPRIIRQGRVASINTTHMVMEKEEPIPFDLKTTIFVDCTANGLTTQEALPIWQSEKTENNSSKCGSIVIQPVATCLIAISAAVIAKIELLCKSSGIDKDRDRFNVLVVPHPIAVKDNIRAILYSIHNVLHWMSMSELRPWLISNRLMGSDKSSTWTKIKLLLMLPKLMLTLDDCGDTMNVLWKEYESNASYVKLVPGRKGALKYKGQCCVGIGSSLLVVVFGICIYFLY